MPSADHLWAMEIPIEIIRGLEGALTVPPRGVALLQALGRQPVPEPPQDELRAFEDAMTGADNAPDRRRALADRVAPHLDVLEGGALADTDFGRWVLAQTPWVFSLRDDDFRTFARWPLLQGLSIHQSRISGRALEHLAEALPDFRRLKLINNRVTAQFWERLPVLARLEELNIDPKGLGDAFATVLLALPRLKELQLPGRLLTSTGLAALAKHPTLESLGTIPVDDDALVALASAPSLRRIRTFRPTVTDAGLKALAATKTELRDLQLSLASKVTDAGAAALATMPQLTHLTLSGAKLTNQGVERLAELPGLIELDIGSCSKITDKSAPSLARMQGLKLLRITRTKITPAGLEVVRRGLGKDCNVVTLG